MIVHTLIAQIESLRMSEHAIRGTNKIIPKDHRGNVISTNTKAAIKQTNQRQTYITKLGNKIHLGLISNQHRMVKTTQTHSLNIIS